MYSQAYVDCLAQGPFHGMTDPFAEIERYFHQIHSGIIALMATSLSLQLARFGYIVSKENNLQIADTVRLSDLTIASPSPYIPVSALLYEGLAETVNAETGILVREFGPEYKALHIRERENVNIVTVIEIISPSHKTNLTVMGAYREKRSRLFLQNGINVIEIDITASVKRLVNHRLVMQTLYHVAVFIPSDSLPLISMMWGQPLKRIAIPLRDDAVAVDLQAVYTQPCLGSISPQLEADNPYLLEALPFPSLFTDKEKKLILERIATWKAECEQLKALA